MIQADLTEEQREKVKKLKKFVNDPDWVVMEEVLIEFIQAHSSIETFDTKRSSDEIAADVRGRQIAIQTLGHYLQEMGALKAQAEKKEKKPNFK